MQFFYEYLYIRLQIYNFNFLEEIPLKIQCLALLAPMGAAAPVEVRNGTIADSGKRIAKKARAFCYK